MYRNRRTELFGFLQLYLPPLGLRRLFVEGTFMEIKMAMTSFDCCDKGGNEFVAEVHLTAEVSQELVYNSRVRVRRIKKDSPNRWYGLIEKQSLSTRHWH